MRIMQLLVAAAIAAGATNLAAAPASARLTGPVPEDRHDSRRHDDRRDHRDWRDDRRDRRDWRDGHHDRREWGHSRARHYGWRNHRRVCRYVWRYGHRQRVCRMVRYRR